MKIGLPGTTEQIEQRLVVLSTWRQRFAAAFKLLLDGKVVEQTTTIVRNEVMSSPDVQHKEFICARMAKMGIDNITIDEVRTNCSFLNIATVLVDKIGSLTSPEEKANADT